MTFRTWVIRGLIFAALAGVAGGVWYAHSYVSPESVRAALIATLGDQLADVDVHVGSARMRVFGGISVRDLRLTRRGDAEPFFVAPTAVIYHDKEQINRGRLAIRKVEMDGPHLRLVRGPDGTWNVAGLARPADPGRAVPTFVVTRAAVTVTDEREGGLPPITLTDAKLCLLNDPLPMIRLDGHATAAVGGVTVRAAVAVQANRATGEVQAGVELPELALGPGLAGLVGAAWPGAAEHVSKLTGRAGVKAAVVYHPGCPVNYKVWVTLSDGRYEAPGLPWPVEKIAAVATAEDGRVVVEKATATVAGAAVEASFETRNLWSPSPLAGEGLGVRGQPSSEMKLNPSPPAPLPQGERGGRKEELAALEDCLEHASVTARGLTLDDSLFARLPADSPAHKLRRAFGPAGTTDLGYRFARPPAGGWARVTELRPAKLQLVYHKFRYPLDDVTGVVRTTVTGGGADETAVDLTGSAAGRRVEVKGTVAGSGPDPAIDLKITGTDVPIDDRLFDALPNPKYRAALKKLRANGRCDFVAEVKQKAGVNLAENTFRITVYGGAFNYTTFPYPLEKVRGKVAVYVTSSDPTRPVYPDRPNQPPDDDRVELRDFEARNGPAAFTLEGENLPASAGKDRKLTLRIWGKDCPMDDRLRAALAAIRLDGVWRTFSPRGRATFGVEVEIADRVADGRRVGPVAAGDVVARLAARAKDGDPPFDPTTDLKLALNFRGPGITPDFFKYPLDDVAGKVRFDGKEVRVEQMTAVHGESKWALAAGEVRLYDAGRVWANLGKLEVNPLVADAAFVDALPGQLKTAAGQLNLRGPAALTVHHLVVLTPPDGPPAGAVPPPLPRQPVARGQQSFLPSPLAGEGPGVKSTANEPRGLPPWSSFPLRPTHGDKPRGSSEQVPLTPNPSPARGEGDQTETPDADVYWRGELRLAGAAFDAGLGWADARGVVACTGRYLGTHLGDVAGTVWLDAAAVADHPVTRVKAAFAARPQEPDPARPGAYLPPAVEVADLTGTLFSGSAGGQARVVLSDPPRYRLWVTATDVRLEDVARHHNLGNGAKLEGLAQGRLELETAPDPRTGELTVKGGGSVDVTNGHILNLPLLVPLLKTLKLQAPDKTAFEEGHATFTVRGDRIRVDHLDLLGTVVSLGGSGELDARGEHVAFEFYTIWSQTLHRWLTTPFGDVTAFVSEQLFRIDVSRGPDGKLKYDPRVVPFVTAPFRAVADRMKRQTGGTVRAAPGK